MKEIDYLQSRLASLHSVHSMGFFIALICLIFTGSVTVQQQCSQVGVQGSRDQANRVQADHLFLGTANPADCRGTVSRFSFCYYAPDINLRSSSASYRTNFGVYRPSIVDGKTVYNLVSGVFTAERTQLQVDSELNYDQGSNDDDGEESSSSSRSSDDDNGNSVRQYSNDDACITINLAEPVTVAVNDVFGACVFDPPDNDIHRLDMVRTSTSSSDVLKRAGTAGCDDVSVPQTVGTFEADVQGYMHLYATVEPLPATEPPTASMPPAMPPTNVPVTDSTTEKIAIKAATLPPTTNVATTGDLTGSTKASTTSASTFQTDSEFVSKGESGNLASVVVPIVLVLLITGAVLGLVMLMAWRRYRKKTARLSPRQPAEGFENMMYHFEATDKSKPSLYTGYDEIVAQTNVSSKDSKHDEYEIPCTPQRRLTNSNVYAEVGPLHEDHTIEVQYGSPMDNQAIKFSELLKKDQEKNIYDDVDPYQVPAKKEGELYDQLKSWGTQSIPRSEIEITGHFGSGQFGSVEQGVWKRQGTKPVDVALKSLTKTSEEDKVKFLQEAAIMAQFRQSNVIQLHGIVVQGTQVFIVIELAAKGDLKGYLQTMRQNPGISVNTSKMLLKFSQQVALGMQYLSAKGFVHRDLAARNVLLTEANICKIADFGMSRDLADENYYVSKGGQIPVKWTAPEAIHYKKYSTASDVWSYGCLLYEIWSLGHKPFEGIKNLEVIRFVDSGKRLSPPPGCPQLIYELMIDCWYPKTADRPAFRDIVLTLVGSEEMVLNIPEEDSSTNPLAGVLGAPLEAGENMYSELQTRYTN